jgi:hypothetical protein
MADRGQKSRLLRESVGFWLLLLLGGNLWPAMLAHQRGRRLELWIAVFGFDVELWVLLHPDDSSGILEMGEKDMGRLTWSRSCAPGLFNLLSLRLLVFGQTNLFSKWSK